VAAEFPLAGRRVWVAGHNGMVGAALVRRLASEDCEILTAPRADVDLTRQAETEAWVAAHRPEAVFVAAAKVGGILANSSAPADFLYDNLMIEANVLHAAARVGVGKLLFLGSSCIYPRETAQPITEEALLTGPLEPTNEAYAIAKIAGIKLAAALRAQQGCDFISAMPTNLYGPGDNFDLTTSHVLPALIRKAHEAKVAGAESLTIWGSGTPRREFLYVDDCAGALVHMMRFYSGTGHLNVGCGEDIAIADLARLVAEAVGFEGPIVTDPSRPDGTPRKLLDVSRLSALGWRARIGLREGVAATYSWYLEHSNEKG
jgi:GDP-L-fucose synthase